MPTIIDANGLSTATSTELQTAADTGLKDIYGADTNYDSNTADGQYFGITIQSIIDYLEVLLAIYNMFDPDNCVGVQQDNLYWINGIMRKGATYSYQNITITVDRALTLQGLDALADDPNGTGYTVADNLGNQWILLDTQTPSVAGAYTYSFRAKTLGAITTLPNTITIPVNIVLGVVSINNATGVSVEGKNGETDPAFKARRNVSFAKRATNSLDGLRADLLNLDGVVSAAVYENDTNFIDADGIPAHGSWSIVEGGSDVDIGTAIYKNVVKALPTKGLETYTLTTIQNQLYTARFDRPSSFPLFVKFDIKPLKIGQTFDEDAIKNYIVDNIFYNIYQEADTASLTEVASQAINAVSGNGSGVPLSLLISNDGVIWTSFLTPPTKKDRWVLDALNITITIL